MAREREKPASRMLVTLTTDELTELIRETVRSELERIQAQPPRQVLNLSQAAELLDRHPHMVMRYVRAGLLTAHFISPREPRFYMRDLFAFIDSMPTQPAKS